MPESSETFLKVTGFVTRRKDAAVELLVFQHPTAGIQLPAGSIEPGEAPLAAAIREVWEETGLRGIELIQPLGVMTLELPPGRRVLRGDVRLVASPREAVTDMCPRLPRGYSVLVIESIGSQSLVRHETYDLATVPPRVLSSIEGWTDSGHLSSRIERHLFLFDYPRSGPPRWYQEADGNRLELFWTPLARNVGLIEGQDIWLAQAYHTIVTTLMARG